MRPAPGDHMLLLRAMIAAAPRRSLKSISRETLLPSARVLGARVLFRPFKAADTSRAPPPPCGQGRLSAPRNVRADHSLKRTFRAASDFDDVDIMAFRLHGHLHVPSLVRQSRPR